MNEQTIEIVESRNPIIIQGATVGSCRHVDCEKAALSPGVPLTIKKRAYHFLPLADETELIYLN